MLTLEIVTVCPYCSEKFDAASNPFDKSGPKPNDRTLCFKCGEWSAFNEDLSIRKLTDDEYIEMARDERVIALRDAWKRLMKL